MPFLHACPTLGARDAVQDLPQLCDAVGRKVNGEVDGVNHPPEDKLHRVPAAVTFAELLEGHRLLTKDGVSFCQGAEDVVYYVEERQAHPTQVGVLRQQDKVTHKNVDVLEGRPFCRKTRVPSSRDGD